ncbi:MAG: bifunctional phosphoribosylaminoimidazolecarboxamide formyltransferase/IMP cyclohydrolase [Bifidobacteriaceae bacterium]|nr:bifunctional phosphoribosylaminoimidazolecarboxamide formyltransferase/IMP cyclohydrolase [Bifidobacteriaceae bacterium]
MACAGDGRRPIRRALVSVYDKRGLTDLARALAGAGVEIVSTGSTAAAVGEAGAAVTPVEALTGFPECLGGRVKTLHPRVHAGVLADSRRPDHVAELRQLGVEPFDLVVVNLYPFTATVARGASADECVEQIDIGGPAMIRAAAKNHPSVAVITSPDQYGAVRQALTAGGFTLPERRSLAAEAFAHTAEYDVAVATWLAAEWASSPDGAVSPAHGSGVPDGPAADAVPAAPASGTSAARLPAWLGGAFRRADTLRYGENPHQAAAVYRQVSGLFTAAGGLAAAELLSGKPMSFNNYGDAEAARRAALDFAPPAVAIVKHANPCGIAVGRDIAEAHRKAHACDPLSAFGGVIAANRPITLELAEQVKAVFTEVIVAPDYDPAALESLRTKKNLRILRLGGGPRAALEFRPLGGGLLVQERDVFQDPGDDPANWSLVAGPAADEATRADLAFAWRAVRSVKSNAILLAKDGASVGIGMGQVNRVDSAVLAARRAGEDRARGAVAASDAFFPFADGLEVLLRAGVKAVVEPGGSVRDQEVVEAAAAAGATLYFTGSRHFLH